jgi:hypothetical protein
MTMAKYAAYRDAFTRGRIVEHARAVEILLGIALWPDPPCWCLDQGEHSEACEAARAYIAEFAKYAEGL